MAKLDVATIDGAASVRRLAAARLLSGMGSAVAAIALSFHMYAITGSPYWVAWTLLLTFGLNGLFAPVAGMIADRYDRRRVMITTDLLCAVGWAGLAFAHRPLVLLPVAFVVSIVGLPFDAAAGAAVPNLVEERGLTWANGLLSAAGNVSRLTGPVLGGLLYVAGGIPLTFGLNAASFAVSAALTTAVRGRFHAPAAATGEPAGSPATGGWFAGFRVVFGDRVMTTLTIWWGMAYLAMNTAYVADLPLTKHFHVGSVGYSLIDTFFGAGLLVGTVLTRYITAGTEWFWVKYTVLGIVAGWGMVALTPWFALVLAGQFVAASIDAFGATAGYTVYQRRAHDSVRGRALAALDSVGLIANVVGFAVAGSVVSWVGPQGFYGIGAVISLLGFLLLCTVRTERTRPVEPDVAADNRDAPPVVLADPLHTTDAVHIPEGV